MLPFTGSLVFADSLTLIEEGQPRAEIILAEKPPRMVNLAAFELQRYLHKITKTRLPIVHEPTGGTPVQIYVGREQLTAYVSDDDAKTWSGGLMIDKLRTSPTPTACRPRMAEFTSSTITSALPSAKC